MAWVGGPAVSTYSADNGVSVTAITRKMVGFVGSGLCSTIAAALEGSDSAYTCRTSDRRRAARVRFMAARCYSRRIVSVILIKHVRD